MVESLVEFGKAFLLQVEIRLERIARQCRRRRALDSLRVVALITAEDPRLPVS